MIDLETENDDLNFDEFSSDQPMPPSDVVTYNELRSCADLYRMYKSGKLEIQPDFQRDIVWSNDAQTRFIDSLVKCLPIPSMCFGLDYKTQKLKVIDGLQRMSSIVQFLDEKEWKLSSLDDIYEPLQNKTNIELKNGSDIEKNIYSQVQDMAVPITIIRSDFSKAPHLRYLFTIFHRLNSGGVRLNNQEIRNCIYSGEFNNFLKSFDKNSIDWINLTNKIRGRMDRFRSVEVLLRVLAFSESIGNYEGKLTNFLNNYMDEKKVFSEAEKIIATDKLNRTISICLHLLKEEAKYSLAKAESLLIGLYVNYDSIHNADLNDVFDKYMKLKTNPDFENIQPHAVLSKANVKRRVNASVAAFA